MSIDHTDYKLSLIAVKYAPIVIFLVMWVHTGLLMLGIEGPFADIVAGSALVPSLLILSISKLFKFCVLHKVLTIYAFCVDLCISFQRTIGFGTNLEVFRIIVFSIGAVIFVGLLIKLSYYKNNCCVYKECIINDK